MKIQGKPYRSIWVDNKTGKVEIIDQTKLPHEFSVTQLTTLDDAATAIQDMWVRGAPLVGATAAYGLCLALEKNASISSMAEAIKRLLATRPTAINLRWALENMQEKLKLLSESKRSKAAWKLAAEICDEDVEINSAIGDNGFKIIQEIWNKKNQQGTVNILTHCNAGWLATVDWGTALSPIYKAHDADIPVHIWVDETRPRNQGSNLTAWELNSHGVPHHVIVDSAGGHLMQHGQIDLCIVGTDRTTASGNVCNKIGTYLKALAAKDNEIPFYVALPSPTIDWQIDDGNHIPIEQRDEPEVTHIQGKNKYGKLETIQLTPDGSPAENPAFDVTPARLITGLITERGICNASRIGLTELFPDKAI